nr:tetrathionate reductase family octaheme c-type cytochrome [Halodesulfovibrio marinisediminis]
MLSIGYYSFSFANQLTMIPEKTYGAEQARKVSMPAKRWVTTDHSRHAVLQQEFLSPEDVTKACLTCHNEASRQIHKTIHWAWTDPADSEKLMGKNGLTLNNFCISIHSNEPRCTSCHAGYGWKDGSFDLSKEESVDCLVCHDTTGTYKKFPTKAGYPVTKTTKFGKKTFQPPNYTVIAASVGRPTRANCGACHFFGGGGDGVKHGDLDSSLFNPSRDLDVHMNAEGANFTCQRCHSTDAHFIAGRTYKQPAFTDRRSLLEDDLVKRISCESCHTATPHALGHKANDHTDKVSCQACHIPAYARVKPTKMYWDWSTAGKKKDGKPYKVMGPHDKASYMTKKGSFVWEKNVQPEYFWYNGKMDYLLVTDKIDPNEVVKVNSVEGDMNDPDSRITPFKVHRGKQPYDAGNMTMAIPHLFGKDKGAYWKGYDWNKSLEAGMAAANVPYSGEYGFVGTEYHYPITHMVAPKEKTLACDSCHARNGRLTKLAGFYMPGRNSSGVVDFIGWFAVIAALIGVVVHGVMRIISKPKEQ